MEKNGIYTQLEDNDLVSFARKGYEDATAELLRRYIPLVRSRASVFTSLDFEYDDMCQEGMIGLYGAIRSFDPENGAPFSAFARLCVDRMLVAVLRSSSRQRKIPRNRITDLDDASRLEEKKGLSNDPESAYIAKEEFDRFQQKANNELSSFEYQVLTAFLSGYNYTEISRQLSKSEKSVDNAMQRIRRKLK